MKQPEIQTPHDLFNSDSRYKAPVYQRLYVWGGEELEGLLDDIDSIEVGYSQFLGAIVLKDLGKAKGPTSPNHYLIIDGQQRLTTLYMIFSVLAHIAQEHGDSKSADYIAKRYLANSSKEFEGQPKLVPTVQDREALWKLLDDQVSGVEWDFKSDAADQKKGGQKITRQWKRIFDHYKKMLIVDGELDKEKLLENLQKVQSNVRFICITLDQNDDANDIFSKLNAKGVPLELADLVRNEIFSKFPIDEPGKADSFYTKHWHPFEKSFPDDSLDAFFPIYSYIAFKGKVTKSNSFPKLQEVWRSLKPPAILSELKAYSPYYSSLISFEKNKNFSNELNGMVERFSRMPRTTVTWPFLIEVLRNAESGELSQKDAVKTLEIIEAFLVRRSIIGIEPTGLHAVFKGLWDKTNGSPKEVLANVVTRTIQCPDDQELLGVLMSEPSDTRVILKYVLEEYERDFRKANKYDPAPTDAATLEHILPQNLSSTWADIFSEDKHKRLIGLLGNLAPLSEKQNKSLKDQSWEEKRKRFKGSNWQVTQELANRKTWDAKIITERTNDIAKWVTNRWPSMESY